MQQPSLHSLRNQFMTVANLQSNELKFRKVMSTKYGLIFDSPQDTTDIRVMLLSEMKAIAQAAKQNDTVHALNVAVLNATRDAVLRSHRSASSAPPASSYAAPGSLSAPQAAPPAQREAQNPFGPSGPTMMPTMAMSRDRDVYGTREVQVMSSSLLPMESASPGSRTDVAMRYEAASQRYEAPTQPDDSRKMMNVTAMDSNEFEARLADRISELNLQLQQQQEKPNDGIPVLYPSLGPFVAQAPPDTLAVMRRAQEEADEFRRSGMQTTGMPAAPIPLTASQFDAGPMIPHPSSATMIPGGPLMSTRMESIIAPPKVTQVVQKYILMNGSDRDVIKEPKRYQFTVKTGGVQSIASLQSSYHNIAWLEVTRVIVPQEIMSAIGIGAAAAAPSGNYNVDFSFAYPYLLLQIDGIDDVCDGTNEALRRSFTSLVYVTEYKAPNGRGYVSLSPGQMERKTYMTPIASLPDLKVSIRKPNGTLFNNSRDKYTVGGNLPTVYNTNFIKIPIDQYFDRNEMWLGDNITIKGLELEANNPVNRAAVKTFQDYLTQTTGHEIIDLPAGNTNQYYNGVYIKIPGMFNQSTGTVVPDGSIAGVLNTGAFTITKPGVIVNTSLQVVVMMTAGIVQGSYNGP